MQNLETIAERLGCSRRHLQRVWCALAELSCKQQLLTRDRVLQYVVAQAEAKTVVPLLYIAHTKYDESPLRLQCRYSLNDQQVTLTKVFAIEHSWCVLLEYKLLGETKHLFLQGALSPRIQGAESATAETIASIMQQCDQMPSSSDVCMERWRLTETDEGPSNLKAEAMLSRVYSPEGWLCSHTLCCAHKVHSIASKTWALQKEPLTGTIRTLLTLQSPGALPRFQESLLALVEEELQVRYCTPLSPEAISYRKRTMELFAPQVEQSKRAAKKIEQFLRQLAQRGLESQRLLAHLRCLSEMLS